MKKKGFSGREELSEEEKEVQLASSSIHVPFPLTHSANVQEE